MIGKQDKYKVTVLDDLVTRTLMVHDDDMMMVQFTFKKKVVLDSHTNMMIMYKLVIS